MDKINGILGSSGEVFVLSRYFFNGKDGEKVRAVSLYVPETHSTINLYGDRNCLAFDAINEDEIGFNCPHSVAVAWQPTKSGFKPRIVSVD